MYGDADDSLWALSFNGKTTRLLAKWKAHQPVVPCFGMLKKHFKCYNEKYKFVNTLYFLVVSVYLCNA